MSASRSYFERAFGMLLPTNILKINRICYFFINRYRCRQVGLETSFADQMGCQIGKLRHGDNRCAFD